jgi:tRNA threonylcarbamoyladenosine biosynthesis protein TsaB
VNLLSIDTSSINTALAFRSGEGEILEEVGDGKLGTASELPILLNSITSKAKIDLSQIDTVLIGEGPGSFTGLRVGFAFLQGIAFDRAIQIGKFASLAAMSSVVASKDTRDCLVIAVAPASKGKIFVHINEKNNNPKNVTQLVNIEDLQTYISTKLRETQNQKASLVCSDNLKVKEYFEPLFVPNICNSLCFVRNIAFGGVQIFDSGCIETKCLRKSEELFELRPNYVQAVSALSLAERGK